MKVGDIVRLHRWETKPYGRILRRDAMLRDYWVIEYNYGKYGNGLVAIQEAFFTLITDPATQVAVALALG